MTSASACRCVSTLDTGAFQLLEARQGVGNQGHGSVTP